MANFKTYVWALIIYTPCIIAIRSIYTFEPHTLIITQRTCCNSVSNVYYETFQRRLLQLLAKLQQKKDALSDPEKIKKPGNQPVTPSDTTPSPVDKSVAEMEKKKAQLCADLTCPPGLKLGPICACNFNTGNVITFKNKCDMKKHNCRFDTGFKVILESICPWEYKSVRSASEDDT